MYSDISDALKGCTVCASQHAVNRVSAWTRTTLYTHPFMALQFDFMKCPEVNGYENILLITCLFSRWIWLVATMDRLAETVADSLLTKVFWPWNVWPSVLRSDNAYEFISEVIRYVNAKLEIRHITGAAYRPQGQGLAENRVKFATKVLTGFVKNHPADWLFYLPAAEGAMRAVSMTALGGTFPHGSGYGPEAAVAGDP